MKSIRNQSFFCLAIALAVAASFLGQDLLAAQKSTRSKVIDFDDELIEGMNKRPLDSFNQLSEKNKKRRKLHLYRKRSGFRTETAETLRELRYTP